MGKFGGRGRLAAGIFLVLLGVVIQSDIVEWLFDLIGIVMVVAGAALGIMGLITVFTGGRRKSTDF